MVFSTNPIKNVHVGKININIFIFLYFVLTIACFGQNTKGNLKIDLIHKTVDNDFVIDDDYYYTTIKLQSFASVPIYEEYLKNNYKGIPQNDSISFRGISGIGYLLPEYIKHGGYTKDEAIKIIKTQNIDSLRYNKLKLKPIIILIGFHKNKQFIIADTNRNEDFDDDIKYEFDINFRDNPYKDIDFLKNLPISEYVSEEITQDGEVAYYNRRFILYPDRNNPYSISSRYNPNKEKEYFSILKYQDYWEGLTIVDSKKIKLSFHGYSNDYGLLDVHPSEVSYKRFSPTYNQQYQYKYYGQHFFLNDTIRINENRYLIDSISRNISKIYLRYIPNSKTVGSYIGEKIDEKIKFHDLNGKTFMLSGFLNKNKYTLIDFWGTWCGPCVALTPSIINLNKKFENKLSILGIAVDNNTAVVKKYISKKKIPWKNAFISLDRCWKNNIIKKLKVQGYPTLILLDSTGKIVYRGSGDALEEIEKILEKD